MDRTKELECKNFKDALKHERHGLFEQVFINLNPINGTFLDLKALDSFCLLADDQTIKQLP